MEKCDRELLLFEQKNCLLDEFHIIYPMEAVYNYI